MAIHESSRHWKPFVRAAAMEVDAKFPRSDWTSTYPGHGENSPVGAYAVDFMCSKSKGDAIVAYLIENRRRLGIRYLIWWRRIINWGRDGNNAQWKPYFDGNSSNPSRAHTNHVHVSFEVDGRYIPLAKPVTMYAAETVKGYSFDGEVKFTREPGKELTGTIQTSSSGKYLVTEAGTWYPVDRLTDTKPKVEEPLTKIRVATYNILSDRAGIKDGGGPLAGRLPALTATMRESKASVLLLQECNKDASALVQERLGADWMWTRVGTRTVMWDKTVWEFQREIEVTLPKPHVNVDKTYPFALLKHITSGEGVWFCSVHFVSSAGNDATSEQIDAQRKASAEAVVKSFNDVTRAVGGGDLNTYSMAKGKAKPVLLAGGLKLLTKDPAFDSAAVDSFDNKVKGGQQIDEIFIKGGRFIDGDIIRGEGSDHHLMVAEIELDK